MLITRPATRSDLDPILELAAMTGFGLTTLPRDRELLAERIADSEHAFRRTPHRPRGETYLFVIEDLDPPPPASPSTNSRTRRVVGTSGIAAKIGGFEPFYAYRLDHIPLFSAMLNVSKSIPTLTLHMDHNGPCEIGSLFLHPDYRGRAHPGIGRLLSLSRFLFIAEHASRFDPTVIAEMRGVIDDTGRSPFWDAIGKHFFDIDFPKADYLSMVNKQFIADLMPRHPIYVPLLPEAAQAVIAQVHPETRPALALLESEGFRKTNLVDIFEGGPVVKVRRENIRTVRDSIKAPVEHLIDELPPDAAIHHILNVRDSRATRGSIHRTPSGAVHLPHSLAAALELEAGDLIRYAPIKLAATIPSELP